MLPFCSRDDFFSLSMLKTLLNILCPQYFAGFFNEWNAQRTAFISNKNIMIFFNIMNALLSLLINLNVSCLNKSINYLLKK